MEPVEKYGLTPEQFAALEAEGAKIVNDDELGRDFKDRRNGAHDHSGPTHPVKGVPAQLKTRTKQNDDERYLPEIPGDFHYFRRNQ